MRQYRTHLDRDLVSLRGYGLVLLAGVFWSAGGIIVRQIEAANEWQILFYRSITLAVTMLILLAARNRSAVMTTFRDVGATGIVAGLCLAAGSISFIFSLTHTTVANTLFMISTSPFMAAILGRILLGEEVRRATWVTMSAAVLGIAVMVGEGAATGGLFGDLTGFGAALAFAGFTVALRRGRTVEMLPAVCLAGVFIALAAGIMAIPIGYGLEISAHDLLLCAIYGAVVFGCGLIIFTIGSRYVTAAELTLLSLTEVVLGPIWVWFGIGEVPSRMTLLGGAIVLAAIVGQALIGMRRRHPPIGAV